MTRGLFISGTGTGIGKTWLTRGLARLAAQAGIKVAALKPIETGVVGHPEDALRIARAAMRPELAFAPGLARRRAPVSPYAAQLAGEPPVDVELVVRATEAAAAHSDLLLVEGAGGLFVPIDADHDGTALVFALELPVLLVAPNRLGVLSDVIATTLAARSVGIEPLAIVLTPIGLDESSPRNAQILSERLDLDVLTLAPSEDEDDALAASVMAAGLDHHIGLGRPTHP
jgi:dethiobiotin synthetase